MILEGFKGVGKSHLLLLLFFALSYRENYRVFYLN
jgi:DNA replication protein DnaC